MVEEIVKKEFIIKGWYWIIAILISVAIGMVLAAIFGGILFGIRKKEDKKLKYDDCFKQMIMPGIFTGLAIVLLVLGKLIYTQSLPFELFILSVIILTGIFSSIDTKEASLAFIGIGAVIFYLGIQEIVRIIKKLKNKGLGKVTT